MWKQEYATESNNRFEILENRDNEDNIDNNINEKWESIKIIINVTKQQLYKRMKAQKHLKINGMMRNANLQ